MSQQNPPLSLIPFPTLAPDRPRFAKFPRLSIIGVLGDQAHATPPVHGVLRRELPVCSVGPCPEFDFYTNTGSRTASRVRSRAFHASAHSATNPAFNRRAEQNRHKFRSRCPPRNRKKPKGRPRPRSPRIRIPHLRQRRRAIDRRLHRGSLPPLSRRPHR